MATPRELLRRNEPRRLGPARAAVRVIALAPTRTRRRTPVRAILLATMLARRLARTERHDHDHRRRNIVSGVVVTTILLAAAGKVLRSRFAGDGEAVGPVQMLVVGFDDAVFTGEIADELDRLRRARLIRLVDLVFVSKEEGTLRTLAYSDLPPAQAQAYGRLAASLLGADDTATTTNGANRNGDDVWFAADAIPDGTAAAVALIEHRWAIPLRDRIARAGGVPLRDDWVHPADLAAAGLGRKTPA